MNCICPECGKEITPIINAVVPNINNGANPQTFHVVYSSPHSNVAQTFNVPLSNNFNANACVPCNPTHMGTFVIKPWK